MFFQASHWTYVIRFEVVNHRFQAFHPFLGRVRVVRHHVHEAEVDQVRPAAHADDAAVQIRLTLP